LKRYFKKSKNKLVGQNIKFDLKVLAVRFGIDIDSVYFDTLPAHALIVGKRGHGLERMSVDHLGIDSYKHILKENRGSELIPLDALADMNMDDCIYTLELAEIFEKQLKEEHLWEYYKKIITPGIPVLKRMEVRGMKVDIDYCRNLEGDINSNIEQIEKKLLAWPEVGNLSLTSNKDLQKLFFEIFKFQTGRKTKTGFSTDKEEVERLFEETKHPFLADLVDYRMLGKLKSTYV
jgi:DNA polymerase-1